MDIFTLGEFILVFIIAIGVVIELYFGRKQRIEFEVERKKLERERKRRDKTLDAIMTIFDKTINKLPKREVRFLLAETLVSEKPDILAKMMIKRLRKKR